MAFAFDATPKGASANSYISVEDADTYFGGRLNSDAWIAAGGNKEIALAMATSRLDAEQYLGTPTTSTQRLKWPRSSVLRDGPSGDDGAWYGGTMYDVDTVPRPIQEACCELALALLTAGTTDPLAATGLEQFERLAVGSIDLTMRDGFRAGQLPDTVSRLLGPFRLGGDGTVRLLRT